MKLLDATTFANKYGVSETCVYNITNIKSNLNRSFKRDDRDLYINEAYFLRRKRFSERVRNESHCYYFALSRHLSDYSIARCLNMIDGSISVASWSTFISMTLFNSLSSSITNVKINKLSWKFWKFCRMIFRYMFYKCGVSPKAGKIEKFLAKA